MTFIMKLQILRIKSYHKICPLKVTRVQIPTHNLTKTSFLQPLDSEKDTESLDLGSLDSGLYDEVVRLYQETEAQQLEFFQSETMPEIFDKRLAAVPDNDIVIGKKIKRLEKVLKSIRQEISRKTKPDSGIIQSLYNNIISAAYRFWLQKPVHVLFPPQVDMISISPLHISIRLNKEKSAGFGTCQTEYFYDIIIITL